MKNFTLTCFLLTGLTVTSWSQAHLNPSFPSNSKVCTGTNATFSVSATGSGTITYQWQESTDGGSTWNDLVEGSTTGINPANGIYTGTAGPVLTITRAPSTMNGNKYQSLVYLNGGSVVVSAQATLNVGPDVSLDDASSTNCPGTPHTLNTAAAGGVSYQWQVSSNSGTSWGNVVDGTDATGVVYSGGATGAMTISSLAPAVNGYQYRYTANDGLGCIITSGVTTQLVPALAVFSLPAGGSVTADVGQAVNIPVTVSSGTGPFTYQWQVAVGAGSFSNISTGNATYTGATSAVLGIPSMTTPLYNNRYRVTIKNGGGCTSASSSFVQIGVMTSLAVGIEDLKAERQDGSHVRLSWTVGSGDADFVVERSLDGVSFVEAGKVRGEEGRTVYAWADEASGSSALQYRIKMQGQNGSAVYSNVVMIGAGGRMELRPNFVTGGVTYLHSAVGQGEILTLAVVDVTGRLWWSGLVRGNAAPLDVSRFGKGLYFVKVSSGGKVLQTLSFVKQ